MSMKKLLLSILLMINVNLFAQGDRPLHEVHASFIFNLTKYIVWPNEQNGNSNFVLGVWGDKELYQSTYNWYNGKPKGTKKIMVKDIKNMDDIYTCDLLYLGKDKIHEFEKVKIAIGAQPILLVTDQQSYGKKGASVNLPVYEDKIKLELNMTSLTAASFKVSTSLTTISKIIH